MEGHPYVIPITVRWRDLDPLGHVNNAVTVTYLELARAQLWADHIGSLEPTTFPFVIARVAVDYRRPIRLGQQVLAGVRLGRLGGASFTLHYRIEADGELAVEAETVQVHLDSGRARPAPMPDELRASLQRFFHG